VPLYVINAIDREGAFETRMATRPAHLEHVRAHSNVKLAGPFLDEAGQPVGSMFILEADDIGQVRTFSDNDPYVKAGVFDRVEIRAFRIVVGDL
jgi:uncharacterized protein YciI